MTAATPIEATTIQEAAELLAKRAVFLRRTKLAAGISDYVDPVVNKVTELADKYAPQAKELYHQHATPIHAALIGGGLGAAAGGLSGLTAEDETRRKPIRSALTGGLAGAAIGGGAGLVANHLPELQKLWGSSQKLDAAQGAAEAQQGLLGKVRPEGGPGLPGGHAMAGFVDKHVPDVTGAGAAAKAIGGDWAGQSAKVVAPVALANEARIGANAWRDTRPLAPNNLQAGAAEFLGGDRVKDLASHLRTQSNSSGAPTYLPEAADLEGKLRGSLGALQSEHVPWFKPMNSLRGSQLAGVVHEQNPQANLQSVLEHIGATGRNANLAAAAKTPLLKSPGMRFAGRAGLYAALPALMAYLQPKAAPILPK